MKTSTTEFPAKLFLFSLGLGLVLLGQSGCALISQQIPGSGVEKTEFRPVTSFDQVAISGFGTARIQLGSEPSLKVTCDDNLLEFVKTEVVDGELRIELLDSIRPTNGLQFEIVTTALRAADFSGAVTADIQSLRGSSFHLGISGSGKLAVDGEVDELEIDISGAASVDAAKLQAKSVKVSVSGSANADVYASESLDTSVSGVGKIQCLGNPEHVTKSISGVGNVTIAE